MLLLPLSPVSFAESDQASANNVNMLDIALNAEVANVNVLFRDLPGNQRAAINVSATGSRGVFAPEDPISLTSQKTTTDSTLTYKVEISRTSGLAPFNLRVNCDVTINPSTDLNISIRTGTGEITFNADRALMIQDLLLETTTGSIDAVVTGGVLLAGRAYMETTTGTAHLHWDDTDVYGEVPVTLKATTGTIVATINQNRQLSGNVTLKAETTTGGMDIAITISGGVGARITANTGFLSSVDVDQTGFSSDKVPLQSENYPAESNFQVNLDATTGGIHIDANYELGVRS